MTLLDNKKIITAYVLLFIISAAGGFFWGSRFDLSPFRKQVSVLSHPAGFFNPKVINETLVIKEKEYLCGDLETIWEGKAPDDLLGADKNKLAEKFPLSEGWVVYFVDPAYLTITVKTDQFCPIHRNLRHLGIYHDMVAVYEGPLGYNQKILRVENMPVEALNPDLRIKLEQAMDFRKLASSAGESLKDELEFDSDEAVNAVLENLDEHS